MGIGAITLDTAGAVTAPTSMPWALGSPLTPSQGETVDYSYLSLAPLPELRGVLMADGIKPVRHIVEQQFLHTGLLAPSAAPTAEPSGVRATAIFDLDRDDSNSGVAENQPPDGAIMWCGLRITWKTTLSSTKPYSGSTEILRGANAAASLANFISYINGTGTEGVEYWYISTQYEPPTLFEISASDGESATVRFKEYGTTGNAYLAFLQSGAWADTSLGTSNETTVGTIAKFAGGTDGTGDEPLTGAYQWAYTGYREVDGAQSGRSPHVETTLGSGQSVDLKVMTENKEDTSADYTRWWRTSSSGNIYRLGYAIPRSVVIDTDDLSDTEMSAAGEVLYDTLAHRSYADGHVPKVRYVARYQGRVFGGGAILSADYSVGTAAVNTASDEVVISTGIPTQDWVGRTFHADDATDENNDRYYQIVKVDSGLGDRKIYLDRDFAGPIVASSAYTVSDARARNTNTLYWSESLLPNQWPTRNHLQAITSANPDGIMGMVPYQDSLIVFTRTGIWQVTPSALTEFQARNRFEGVGCVSGHGIISAEGYVFFPGDDGIYQWSGETAAPSKLSSPPASAEMPVMGIQATWNRVSRAHASRITAHYDPEEREITWRLPLDGASEPNYRLVFELQTGTFSLDTVQGETVMATVLGQDGEQVTLSGNQYGHLMHQQLSSSDGAYAVEQVNTLTSSTTRTLTVSGAAWTTDQFAGCPVWIIDATGGFTRATVTSNTGTVLSLAEAITSPGAVQVVVGGICMDVQTGRFHFNDPGARRTLAAVRMIHVTDTDGQYFVASAADQGTPGVRTIASGSLTASDGETRFRCHRAGRFQQLRFVCVEPGCDPEFLGYELEVRARMREGIDV